MEVKDYISLGSLLIALVAIFLGPMINFKISNRQVIAPMRQAWINSLRDNIAEFISTVIRDTHNFTSGRNN